MNRASPILAVLLAALLLVASAFSSVAEEKKVLEVGKWYPSAEAGMTFTQSTYSDNWGGGDRGAIVWTAIVNAALENQFHTRVNSSSALKLAFGQTHQQSDGEDRGWERPGKSTDLADLETILRFTLGGYVDPFVSGRVETQFQDRSDPFGRKISFNPVLIRESAGIARQFSRTENRSILSRLGFTFRHGIRRYFPDFPSTDTRSEASVDGGVEWTTDAKANLLTNRVTWTSKLSVYQPVFYSGKGDLDGLDAAALAAAGIDQDVASFTTATDVDWENILSSRITRLISVNLYTRWLYDKYDNSVMPVLDASGALANPSQVKLAIRKAGQFKQTMAIGVTYQFL